MQYSQLKINHLNDTPSTKAAGGGIYSGVLLKEINQGTSQGQEDFELSWYLFFQQGHDGKSVGPRLCGRAEEGRLRLCR